MDIAEIVRLAEYEGRPGLYRWIEERTELLRGDSRLVESLFISLNEVSTGVALWFAVVLRTTGLLPPAATLELERAEAGDRRLWVTGVCHVMMPHILDRVRRAMEKADVLFGWHCYFCGGGGPGLVLFTSIEDFEKALQGARPGDYFQLASLQQLTDRIGRLEPTLAVAREYLTRAPRGEIWVLRTGVRPPALEILWADNRDEAAVESWFHPSHGLHLAPLREDLEFDVDRYFVDAKKPDSRGAIPLLGAY
jgi:hypothetical protein